MQNHRFPLLTPYLTGPGPGRDTGPRRIYNYARGANGETDGAENTTTGGAAAGGGGGGGGDGNEG